MAETREFEGGCVGVLWETTLRLCFELLPAGT